MKRRKVQEDEVKQKIEAGETDESALDDLPLPAISYVSMTSRPVQLPR